MSLKVKTKKQAEVIENAEPTVNHYTLSADESIDTMKSSRIGLNSVEADARREKYGKNALIEGKKKNPFIVFLEQFKDLLVIILIIAAIVSGIANEIASMCVIFAVILMNAVLGTVQYLKAEKSLAALKKMSAPSAKVMRDGAVTIVASEDIVPGDIIVLEAGDLVVADGRIIDNYSLQVNESALTGESTVVDKTVDKIDGDDVPLGDRTNSLYSGSLVTYGRAVMVVTGTGMNTEIGKIAALMNTAKERKTPLQRNLDQFSKVLAMIIMGICVLVFGLTLWRDWGEAAVGTVVLNSLIYAVALAVAAIPEALSSIVTIVQAMGTQKMAKQNAIIKDLKAVESLGSVSIICSDKTGTLTQNKMTAKKLYVDGSVVDNLDIDNDAHRALLHAAMLVNDSVCNESGEQIGDPTEVALTILANSYGLKEVEYREKYPRLSEIAFDSDRKLMSILLEHGGKRYMFTKGAIDVMLSRTDNLLTATGERKITREDLNQIERINTEFSSNGLRVLSFGMKEVTNKTEIGLDDEYGFTFVGLVSMIDPPREESTQAVADAIGAGIKPIMITGDHKITASAIAREIGILKDGERAVDGVELERMTDEELDAVLADISVYARVSPEHKIRIVEAWQRRGNIVAMTGDGVNDAPALKKADIGVAMGITGTEVSKDAADMILTDDNFATIVKSVSNGRSVYANIKNAVVFLLSGNIAAIICIVLTALLDMPRPFDTVHLLFINLLTDSLPAIAIGMEPARRDLLLMPPRDPKSPLLNGRSLTMIAVQGAVISAFTMGAYMVGYATSPEWAMTMAFATVTLARLFHGFNCRGDKDIISLGITSNMYQIYAFLAGVVFLIAVLFIPGINSLFKAPLLSASSYGYIVLFAICPTVVIQLFKGGMTIYKKYKEGKAVKSES